MLVAGSGNTLRRQLRIKLKPESSFTLNTIRQLLQETEHFRCGRQ